MTVLYDPNLFSNEVFFKGTELYIYLLFSLQVMETKNMLYLVSEYAPNGEIFGKFSENFWDVKPHGKMF